LLYGVWNFGGGALTIGQIYTPVFTIYSNQVGGGDGDLVTYGAIYAGRQPSIQLSMGGLKIALVTSSAPGGTVAAATDTDTSMPKLEVAYSLKAGSVSLKPMFGYHSYDVVDAANKEYGIDSYILGVGFSGGFGAAYVKGSVYMGENLGNYGILEKPGHTATYDVGTNSIKNCDSMGYQLIAGFKASDMITIEAGYG